LAFGRAGVDGLDASVPELRDVVAGVDDDRAARQAAEQPGGKLRDTLLRDGDDHDICVAGDFGDEDRGRAGLGGAAGERLRSARIAGRDLMPEPGEPGGERGAHVPGADDPDAHAVLLCGMRGIPCPGVRGRS
jgi:hypothetical protein